jgi:hypothetical protein
VSLLLTEHVYAIDLGDRILAQPSPPLAPLPDDQPGRISEVGTTLWGRDYRRRLAEALGISRTTLWKWMAGGGKRRDIDADLEELLETERDAASERELQIADLRRRFIARRRSHA